MLRNRYPNIWESFYICTTEYSRNRSDVVDMKMGAAGFDSILLLVLLTMAAPKFKW